jgi:zinc transport system substrate-binding protein
MHKKSSVRFRILCVCLMLLATVAVSACQKNEGLSVGKKKLIVVTTLFPLYDFSRSIGGEKSEVSLILPPGVEPHHFEPRPADIARIENADIFIYTGSYMEPWVDRLLKGINRSKFVVVDAGAGVHLLKRDNRSADENTHGHARGTEGEREGKIDPHIWLDFFNAGKMVDNITAGFVAKDPEGRNYFTENAEAYKKKLREMDKKYRGSLSHCQGNIIVHAGHFAFGYLAKRYGLRYVSAYPGVSLDQEPTPRRLIEITDIVKRYGLRHIFYEELITPRVAMAISSETGASLLMLHAAHNITKEEMERGVTFLSLMEKNLENLRAGLKCP